MKERTKKLKPVIFESAYTNRSSKYKNNKFQQNLLLKALQVTTDPQELKKMAGLKTVADVYRTLDKLSIRREYHEALARHGLSLDLVVEGIKDLVMETKSDAIKLKGYQTLLRSLGLERYEKEEETGKQWEDVLLQDSENKRVKNKELAAPAQGEYEVTAPEIPEEEKKREEEEKEAAKRLYEGKV